MKHGLAVAGIIAFTSLACLLTFAFTRQAYRPRDQAAAQPARMPAAPPPEPRPHAAPPAPVLPKPQDAPILPAPQGAALPLITATELKAKLDAKEDFLLAFVGNRSYFDERHIPGAVCVPYTEIREYFTPIARDREIVLYCGCCGGASDGVSGNAVRILQIMGFTRISHLLGHYAAWQAMQYHSDGTNPVAIVEHAYRDPKGKQMLDEFVAEGQRRRRELAAAVEAEPDAARRLELSARLSEVDLQLEREGLLLKRKLAVEAGDQAKIDDIDRILRDRDAQQNKPK